MLKHPHKVVIYPAIILVIVAVVYLSSLPSMMIRLFSGVQDYRRMTAYHDFFIAGNIVDENGNPIDNAKVSVTTSRRINSGFDSITKKFTPKDTRSTFKYEFDSYSSIQLTIFGNGYRTKYGFFEKGGTYQNLWIVLHQGSSDSLVESPEVEKYP